MSEISDRYRRLSDAFAATIAAVPDDAWQAQTPCEEWKAVDVVRHVVDTQGMFLGFVGRSLPEDVPSVDDDPAAAFEAARSSVLADLEDAGRASEEFDGMLGRQRFDEAVDRFLNADLVVHRWDLGAATGQDVRLDEADISRIDEGLNSNPEIVAKMRGPGAFGPEVEPPPDADAQARFLAFLGRRV